MGTKVSCEMITRIFLISFVFCITCTTQLTKPLQSNADTLIQQLRDLPTPLPASPRSDGSVPTEEQRRRRLYEEILRLGPNGVLALSRALHDDDVHLRSNAALALSSLAGGWYDSSWARLDIRPALPALVVALQDSEANVRGWSAQAIGEIGAGAKGAVPDLITLLSNPDEGSRNSACIALRGIGPGARPALPALKKSLSDPSKDVRQFAALAIKSIER
jgi:HEAT repeat protein